MFLFAGLLRMVITHQTTFLINSLCHLKGDRPWDEEASTAGCGWSLLPTVKAGTVFHRFPSDYRNGYFWRSGIQANGRSGSDQVGFRDSADKEGG